MDSVIGSVIAGLIVFGTLCVLAFSIIWIVRVPSPIQVSNGSAQAISQPEPEPEVQARPEIAPEKPAAAGQGTEEYRPEKIGQRRPLTLAIAASCGVAVIFVAILVLFAPRGHTPVVVVPAAHAQSQPWSRNFTIDNRSSKSFTHINMRFLFQKWAVPPSGDIAIPSGASASISFPPTANDDECVAGVWLKFAEGNEAVLGYDGIDICRISQITLTDETRDPTHRSIRYQTDKMTAPQLASDSKYGTLYFNQGWEKKEAGYRDSVEHRKAIAQGCCEDRSSDPDFVQQCAPDIVKLRPQDNNGTASDQFGGAKILWAMSGNYTSGPDTGRRYFKTLMALTALDGVRYRLTSVDCNLPFNQRRDVSFTWGGTSSWWNEIVDRAVQQKMSGTNLVNEDGYSFRCFSSEACTSDPAPRLGLPTIHDLMYGNTRTER